MERRKICKATMSKFTEKLEDILDGKFNFNLGMKIGAWFIFGCLALLFIFAHKLFNRD
jgi:hypothetical protein